MSYPYDQFSGEGYTSTSPTLDVFPQWETVEREEQQQQQQETQGEPQQQSQHHDQSPQHQHRSEMFPSTVMPLQQPPHQQQRFQTIQLQEPPVVPSQHQPPHDDTPVHLHHVQRPERRRVNSTELQHLHVDTSRPDAAPSMAIRPSRSSTHQKAHPYRRPSSAASTTPRPREQQVRFASGPSSSMPSPAVLSPITMASPGTLPSRMGFGSTVSSPLASQDISLPRALSRVVNPSVVPTPSVQRRPFIIRTDSNYDPETKILTAMFELPGVKKADLRVTLSTCQYNGVRQITVSGRTAPVFPLPALPNSSMEGEDLTIRERKFGEFSRTIPVPSSLKREDVDASMEDGILTLKIPCGEPSRPDAQEIPVQ